MTILSEEYNGSSCCNVILYCVCLDQNIRLCICYSIFSKVSHKKSERVIGLCTRRRRLMLVYLGCSMQTKPCHSLEVLKKNSRGLRFLHRYSCRVHSSGMWRCDSRQSDSDVSGHIIPKRWYLITHWRDVRCWRTESSKKIEAGRLGRVQKAIGPTALSSGLV
jgi:hypothetical protein